jgi:serine/threonine protein kinase
MTLGDGDLWGAYRLGRPVGSGPSGTVHQAVEISSGAAAHVKIFHAGLDPAALDRFERESRRLIFLRHPSILRVDAVAREGGRLGVVLEPFEGANLRARRPGSAEEARAVLLAAAQALSAAWGALILHRNLKPENVLVGPSGEVRVSDFACFLEETAYWSPERRQGRSPDVRADLYSLGTVFRDCLDQAPPDLEEILRDLTRPEPVERIQMIEDLLKRLEARPATPAAVPEPPSPPPATPEPEREPPPAPRPERAAAPVRRPAPLPSSPVPPPTSRPPAPEAFRRPALVPAARRRRASGCIGCLVPFAFMSVALFVVYAALRSPDEEGVETLVHEEPARPPEAPPPAPPPRSPLQVWTDTQTRLAPLLQDLNYAEAHALVAAYFAAGGPRFREMAQAEAALKELAGFVLDADAAAASGQDLEGVDRFRRYGAVWAKEAERVVARWCAADWKRTSAFAEKARAEGNGEAAVKAVEEFLARRHRGGAHRAEAEERLRRLRPPAPEAPPKADDPDQLHAGGRAILGGVLGEGKIAWTSDQTRLFDLEKREVLWTIPVRPYNFRLALGGGLLAVPGSNRISLRRLSDGVEADVVPVSGGVVTCVALSRDGSLLAAGTSAATLIVWDVAKQEVLREEKSPARGVQCAAFSPDGRRLAFGGWDRTVYVWDLPKGPGWRLEGMTARVSQLAWSEDGSRLVSGGTDRDLHLWDLREGVLIRKFAGHTGGMSAVALSPDGKRVAAAATNGSLRAWSLEGEEPAIELAHPHGKINFLGFLPSGRLLSAGADGTLRVHDLR